MAAPSAARRAAVRLPPAARRAPAGRTAEALVIAPPARAPERRPTARWGVFLPLYALPVDGPVAGFGDLRRLVLATAARGSALVGTTPLYAAFLDGDPFEPSPYSPASRLFWNDLFIDLDGPARARALGRGPRRARGRARGARRRARRLPRHRRRAPRRCCRRWPTPPYDDDARRAALEAYLAATPQPGRLRRLPRRPPRTDPPAARRRHAYAQWVAEQQLADVARAADAAGSGLYLDLPLGVHRAAYDVAAEPRVVRARHPRRRAARRARPEPARTGSSRRSTPSASRETGHRYTIACLRTAFRHARALRIDHVAGLPPPVLDPGGLRRRRGAVRALPRRGAVRHRARGGAPPRRRGRSARTSAPCRRRCATRSTSSGSCAATCCSSSSTAEGDGPAPDPAGAEPRQPGHPRHRDVRRLVAPRRGSRRPRRRRPRRRLAELGCRAGTFRPRQPGGPLGRDPPAERSRDDRRRELAAPRPPRHRSARAAARRRRHLPRAQGGPTVSTKMTPSGIGPDRPAPLQRGHATRACTSGWARTPRSRTAAPASRSRVGAERRGRVGHRRLQRLGRRLAPAGAGRGVRHLGRRSCRTSGRARSTSTTIALARARLRVEKADPFAFRAEEPPRTGSVVADLDLRVGRRRVDGVAAAPRSGPRRADLDLRGAPRLVAARRPTSPTASLGYRELAPLLADHATRLGFTHVELLPIMEHPFYGSWGYQTTGYFAPTSRYGSPQDLMYLIDDAAPGGHRRDPRLGAVALPDRRARRSAYFDGTHLFEHADPRQGFHPDWKSCIFNYGRNEVRSFLLSVGALLARRVPRRRAARRRGRLDALPRLLARGRRVDPERVRRPGEPRGDRLPAQLNEERVRARIPTRRPIAEESTAWPMVSRPTYLGGLGFGFKWDMGWMHDTLQLPAARPDPPRLPPRRADLPRAVRASPRTTCCRCRTTRSCTARARCSARCPATTGSSFANLRLLFGYQWAQPGQEAAVHGRRVRPAARVEPRAQPRLAPAATTPRTPASQRWVADLNRVYRGGPGAARARLRPGGLRVGRRARRSVERPLLPAPRARAGSDLLVHLQLHAGAARQLPRRRAVAAAAGARC